jgi:hypothetical protein
MEKPSKIFRPERFVNICRSEYKIIFVSINTLTRKGKVISMFIY